MLKTQITGAKYLSPQTNQMTNLNIAIPADSKDTEFGTSDILLAKDTAALVADAKRAAFEGEKTTLLAPTQVTSDIKFEKDINLSDGGLHIKVQFNNLGTGMPNGSEWKLMQIGEMNVCIVQHGATYNPQIQYSYPDSTPDIYPLHDGQLEIIVRKDGEIRHMTGDLLDPNDYYVIEYCVCEQQFKLTGFDTLVGDRYYTCEVFQYNFLDLKMSQLENDCDYIKLNEDGILSIDSTIETNGRIVTDDSIVIGNNRHGHPYPCITFCDDTYNAENGINISATDDSIYFPYNTYICYSGDDTDYNHVLSLSEIASYYMLPIYSIVESLPPRGGSKVIYMIKKTDPTDPNVKYDKYIYIKEDSAWEKIG